MDSEEQTPTETKAEGFAEPKEVAPEVCRSLSEEQNESIWEQVLVK